VGHRTEYLSAIMLLPSEILSQICGLMSKQTLKCVRMTCKALEQATVPFLFDEVFMSATHSDIEIANYLTTRFAQHIKTITLSFYCFFHFTKSRFAQLRQHKHNEWRRECIEIHEKHAYTLYCKARAEHIDIMRSAKFLAQLCQVLVGLPAVRKLVFTDYGCGFNSESSDLDPHGFWKRYDLCPLESCTLSKADHAEFYIGPDPGYGNHDPNPWQLVMQALLVADPPITEIVSKSIHYRGLIPMGSFIMTPRQIQDVTMSSKVLTKLRLSLSDEDINQSEFHRSYVEESSVSRALSAAVNLRNLFIKIDGRLGGASTFFSIILKGCRFPKLRSLILVNMDAEEQELLDFLGASPLLENLFLCLFDLDAGSWESAAARVKSILQLKRMEFAKLSGPFLPSLLDSGHIISTDHRLVEDFFLRNGENPFTTQAVEDFYENNDKDLRDEINRGIGNSEELYRTYH